MYDYSNLMKLIKRSLSLKRNKEFEIVCKAAQIPPECKSENINESITVAVKTEIGERQHRCELYGYTNERIIFLDNPDEEVMNALMVIEQDNSIIYKIREFLSINEKDSIIEMLPAIEPFFRKADEITKKEKKEEREIMKKRKEEEHRRWKEAYKTCLELFGDKALG